MVYPVVMVALQLQRFRLLRGVAVIAIGIDPQLAEHVPSQGTFGQHALSRSVATGGRLASRHKPRQTRPWERRPGQGDRRRRGGVGTPPRALRGTRSDGPREAWLAVGRRPAMPGRPCTPEAGAANDLASAHVAEHWHRFRIGVDQADYLRLLRCFDSFARAVPHASVTRRAMYYGFHRQMVSIQPSGTKAGDVDPRRSQGGSPACRTTSSASP